MSMNLDRPFSILVASVRAFEGTGKPCVGALLKPKFLQALGGGLTERSLGFGRFGEFLRAAQAAGHVNVSVRSGGDLEVAIPADPKPAQQLSLTSSLEDKLEPSKTVLEELDPKLAIRVRPDLWRAFNAASGGWVYDTAGDVAFRPSDASQISSSHLLIPPAKANITAWMRDFAQLQPIERQTHLLQNVEQDATPFKFESLLRATPNVLRAWRRFHVQRIISEIEAWAYSKNIKLSNVAEPYRSAVPALGTHTVDVKTTDAKHEGVEPSLQPQLVPPSQLDSLHPNLLGKLPDAIDELIDKLITLRGLLAVKKPLA